MDLHCIDEGGGDGDDGESEPLLFVHGWTCDASDFLSQIRFFRRTHRVIAPDLRGHGRSPVTTKTETMAGAGAYEPRAFARDLVGLLDVLGIHRVVAIGHSLGGLLVSILAVDYPGRISAVVCLDPVNQLIGEWLSTLQHTTEGEDIRGVISETGSCSK